MTNNKELKYAGFSTVPSDYDAPDGELAFNLNLINEDGAIKTINLPAFELKLPVDHGLILIHSVPGQENFITLTGNREGTFCLNWFKRDQEKTMATTLIETSVELSHFVGIKAVGNTLIVATGAHMYYILWKDNTYKFLGNKPPFLPISFGAYKIDTLVDTTSTSYTDVPYRTLSMFNGGSGGQTMHVPWTEEDTYFWTDVSNQALGLLLKTTAEKVSANGYMYQPFFIRYAFKLFDGSYSWHSAPVLMLVSTTQPVIFITGKTSDGELELTCKLEVPYFGIAYCVLSEVESFKEWSDIITDVDIFVSSPIYTYNQDKAIGAPIRHRDLFGYISQAQRPGADSRGNSSELFLGHYSNNGIDGVYADQFLETPLSELNDLVCSLQENENFNDRIQHESLFYKIASLPVTSIDSMDSMAPIPLIKTDLSQLTTLENLKDDYNSHAELSANSLFSYNQRLIICCDSIAPPVPFLLSTVAQTTSSQNDVTPDSYEKVKVYTRINGTVCMNEYTIDNADGSSPSIIFPLSISFPRYIYYPDSSAFKMEIYSGEKFFSLNLMPHPLLNGAYWFGGLGVEPSEIETIPADLPDAVSSVNISNKIYVSEINNPFIFHASNILTIGNCKEVFDISTAAKALSQGQFGQFPLYAFTDEGVWALEISSSGTISARQPITRDVCISPKGITQIDSSVLFPTARGIMLISGSQTKCISEQINSDYPFDVRTLPAMDKLHSMIGHNEDTCIPTAPFSTFLHDCEMIYDYTHQRIIVFNPAFSYSYIYSLKTFSWSMIYSHIKTTVNSYPEALAVDENGDLIDFSKYATDDNGNIKTSGGLLITRPLKLDAPDIHKTIESIIQRGNFQRGNVQSVLYGSRDLTQWHLVWSSTDHYLSGFRGTPYKYFRIALVCHLSPQESISGASILFAPRLTDKPR